MKVIFILMSLLGGCGSDDIEIPGNAAAALEGYGAIVSASYRDSVASAEAMREAIDAFREAPTAETLGAARDAWRAAREPYPQTEVYRFYDGPIDAPEDGPEGRINSWPLDESYIDYVEGDANAGLVNDPARSIDDASLMAANQAEGEDAIALGYHAVEFLLWGQDRNDASAGDRSYLDYVVGDGATAPNGDRRARYLEVATERLVTDLSSVEAQWRDQPGTYRAELERVEPREGLRRILTGMIVLSGFETGGERLQVALDSGDQEDEHSCFSDNTHRDMVGNARGIQNVFEGRYVTTSGETVSGTPIYDVVRELDAQLADDLRTNIADSVRLAEALEAPFDREIATDNEAGRGRVRALIGSLRAQERLLERVFVALGLRVEIPQ